MTQFAFKRTGDADYPRYLKILVIGPPKSGKTTFIATAPNVVVAACEAGLMSIAHKNVAYVDIDDATKIETLHLVLKDDTLRKRAAAQNQLPDIETVAIDTLDAFQELLKQQILRESRRTEMQQADWGKLKERMAGILKSFCALPMNVIFTVHSDVAQDENSKQIYAPLLQGGIKNDIAGYVDYSLMSFRQKETLADGTTRIAYYLKAEGDDRNPHLGNRAAGRLPEIVAPSFKTLHDAVFKDLNLPQTAEVAVETTTPAVKSDEEVATPASQPTLTVVTRETGPVEVKPTGTPKNDDNGPINAAGLSAVKKAYQSVQFVLPEDLDGWQLGKARRVARIFAAVKADIAQNKATRKDLRDLLKAEDAWWGEADVAGKPKKKQPAVGAEQAEGDNAVATVEATLGGQVIGVKVEAGALCDQCGKPVDDLEIAQLAVSRFRQVLCLADYMSKNESKGS